MTILKKRINLLIEENVDQIKNLKRIKKNLSWYKFKEKKRLIQSKIDSTKRVVENLIRRYNSI